MKYKIVLSLITTFLLLACRDSVSSSVDSPNTQQTPEQTETAQVVSTDTDEIWTPTDIEECMTKVNVGEPFKFETTFNPFYLRADLDGNTKVDYALLIKGENSKKRGVVICKDSKQPFVFGELSNPKSPLSSFENDNFITPEWVVSTREFTRIESDSTGRKIASDAKGESIWFLFEGSNGVTIYWDGKGFRVVG
jgi:hypothetical protein